MNAAVPMATYHRTMSEAATEPWVLYDWAPSPFCVKVRALLDHKRLPYRRQRVLGPALWQLYRRGRVGKVPALQIGDRLITDSTDIAFEIERLHPHPPVLPADPARRAQCVALEDWCDEWLYFIGLYHQWVDPEGAPMVPQAFGRGPLGRVAYAAYRRRIGAQLRGQGLGRKPAERIADDLQRAVDTIDALLQPGPYLLGEQPMLCDFALFGQLVYWTRPPKTARAIAARPAIQAFMARMKALRDATR